MKTTKTSTKPKLNVKLLRRIQKHILEEPRRFFMGWFIATGKPQSREFVCERCGDDFARTVPPCGTAACIAGWANLLSGVKPNGANDPIKAMKFLGLSHEQAQQTFSSLGWPEPFAARYDKADRPSRRAQIAADRIEHLIKTGE